MEKSKLIKKIEVRDNPSYLIEAAKLMDDYLVWKDEAKNKHISFYDRDFYTDDKGNVSITYLVDRYSKMEDYVIFVQEVRKEAKLLLDEFFTDKNEDIHFLHKIHRHDNQNEFSFMLSLLSSFGRDRIERISKEDFLFQTKMMFLMFVDDSLLDDYAISGVSRPMMEKEFQSYDLVALILKTSYTNKESMAIFRALYEYEDIYERLFPLLSSLEDIVESKFYLVEERYKEKLKAYIDTDFDFAYKILNDVGFNDMKLDKAFDAYLTINLLHPRSAAFRSILLDPDNLELSLGLVVDEVYSKEDDKFLDSYNQDKLRVFSDPTRFEIIKLLQKKDYYVKEMADILYLTPATLSYHLNQLQIAGFIGLYYEGRKSYYYLRKDTLMDMGDYLHNFAENIKEGGSNEES